MRPRMRAAVDEGELTEDNARAEGVDLHPVPSDADHPGHDHEDLPPPPSEGARATLVQGLKRIVRPKRDWSSPGLFVRTAVRTKAPAKPSPAVIRCQLLSNWIEP